MRLFIAIPLADAVKHELSALSSRLQSPNDGLRWSSPESWHITLQFLGNVQPDQYACLGSQLRKLHSPPVSMELEGLSSFPRAGVLIVSVRVTPELLQLQQGVVAATEPCGFVPESRPFQPHITLARSNGKGAATLFRKLESNAGRASRFTPFTAEEFLLYESFLGSAGSRYEIREHFPLRKN